MGGVHPSDHALERWETRARFDMDLMEAWRQATEVSGSGISGDEIRYHLGSNTFIVRKDDTLVTVLWEGSTSKRARKAAERALFE